MWEVSDAWGQEGVWTENRKGVGLLQKIFQHTEIGSKRAINKCSEGPSIELARTPGEYAGTEAPTKLSTDSSLWRPFGEHGNGNFQGSGRGVDHGGWAEKRFGGE